MSTIWELKPAVTLPGLLGPGLGSWLNTSAQKAPPLWIWVGRVSSEARGFVRCWLMQARAYEHAFVEALLRRARRAFSQARPAEPVAGEFERADGYFEDMGKLGSARERQLGSAPAAVAAA